MSSSAISSDMNVPDITHSDNNTMYPIAKSTLPDNSIDTKSSIKGDSDFSGDEEAGNLYLIDQNPQPKTLVRRLAAHLKKPQPQTNATGDYMISCDPDSRESKIHSDGVKSVITSDSQGNSSGEDTKESSESEQQKNEKKETVSSKKKDIEEFTSNISETSQISNLKKESESVRKNKPGNMESRNTEILKEKKIKKDKNDVTSIMGSNEEDSITKDSSSRSIPETTKNNDSIITSTPEQSHKPISILHSANKSAFEKKKDASEFFELLKSFFTIEHKQNQILLRKVRDAEKIRDDLMKLILRNVAEKDHYIQDILNIPYILSGMTKEDVQNTFNTQTIQVCENHETSSDMIVEPDSEDSSNTEQIPFSENEHERVQKHKTATYYFLDEMDIPKISRQTRCSRNSRKIDYGYDHPSTFEYDRGKSSQFSHKYRSKGRSKKGLRTLRSLLEKAMMDEKKQDRFYGYLHSHLFQRVDSKEYTSPFSRLYPKLGDINDQIGSLSVRKKTKKKHRTPEKTLDQCFKSFSDPNLYHISEEKSSTEINSEVEPSVPIENKKFEIFDKSQKEQKYFLRGLQREKPVKADDQYFIKRGVSSNQSDTMDVNLEAAIYETGHNQKGEQDDSTDVVVEDYAHETVKNLECSEIGSDSNDVRVEAAVYKTMDHQRISASKSDPKQLRLEESPNKPDNNQNILGPESDIIDFLLHWMQNELEKRFFQLMKLTPLSPPRNLSSAIKKRVTFDKSVGDEDTDNNSMTQGTSKTTENDHIHISEAETGPTQQEMVNKSVKCTCMNTQHGRTFYLSEINDEKADQTTGHEKMPIYDKTSTIGVTPRSNEIIDPVLPEQTYLRFESRLDPVGKVYDPRLRLPLNHRSDQRPNFIDNPSGLTFHNPSIQHAPNTRFDTHHVSSYEVPLLSYNTGLDDETSNSDLGEYGYVCQSISDQYTSTFTATSTDSSIPHRSIDCTCPSCPNPQFCQTVSGSADTETHGYLNHDSNSSELFNCMGPQQPYQLG